MTKDKIEFTYGRVEARIRVPAGQGFWPAFWMLGADVWEVGWPASGEIDIMEYIGQNPHSIYGHIHGPGHGRGNGFNISTPVANNFHVFAVEWEENVIRWYVDGHQYFSATPSDIGGGTWVYNKPFYIILNLSVGGSWPGSPDETTPFPSSMLIDYVRVYQRAN